MDLCGDPVVIVGDWLVWTSWGSVLTLALSNWAGYGGC